MLVLARGDALIHLGETGFQTRCEFSQMLPDRLLQARQAHARHARALLPPSLVVHQVILETPEAYAITTEDIAGFEPVAQQTIHQKLIAIRQETSVPVPVLGVQVPFGSGRDKAEGDGLR